MGVTEVGRVVTTSKKALCVAYTKSLHDMYNFTEHIPILHLFQLYPILLLSTSIQIYNQKKKEKKKKKKQAYQLFMYLHPSI